MLFWTPTTLMLILKLVNEGKTDLLNSITVQ